jgi:hypothetical protein
VRFHASKIIRCFSLQLLELTELNIFSLLMSASFDYLLEYTNESLTHNGLRKLSTPEFRRFLGTLLLSSTFNVSTDLTWSLLESLTNKNIMSRERFNVVLQNLRGFEVLGRSVDYSSLEWKDQKDLLHNLHFLEDKMFERSKQIFFESRYGCYVLDDELVASKASDVEVKTLSTRKSGKEGSTADVICDSFLQLVLGMRLRTSVDTQIENVEKLMDRLPPVEKNSNQSDLGPWLACDRGYGKKKVIQMFAEKKF